MDNDCNEKLRNYLLIRKKVNYLHLKILVMSDELKLLNNPVSGYFDLVEISAIEHRLIYLSEYFISSSLSWLMAIKVSE